MHLYISHCLDNYTRPSRRLKRVCASYRLMWLCSSLRGSFWHASMTTRRETFANGLSAVHLLSRDK